MMRNILLPWLLAFSLAIYCSAGDMKPNNQFLTLVDGYPTSKRQEFDKIKLGETRRFRWNGNTVNLVINSIENSHKQTHEDLEISGLQIYSTENDLVEHFSLNYTLFEYHLNGLYRTAIGDRDSLIISHYLPGATGWTANAIIFHIILETEAGYKYQELSTFFSQLDSFVDLDGDGISEFICVNLVLDTDGNFVVPVVFSLDNEDNFSRTTSTVATVPGLMDPKIGLIPKKWSEVPESVKTVSSSSIPRALE